MDYSAGISSITEPISVPSKKKEAGESTKENQNPSWKEKSRGHCRALLLPSSISQWVKKPGFKTHPEHLHDAEPWHQGCSRPAATKPCDPTSQRRVQGGEGERDAPAGGTQSCCWASPLLGPRVWGAPRRRELRERDLVRTSLPARLLVPRCCLPTLRSCSKLLPSLE